MSGRSPTPEPPPLANLVQRAVQAYESACQCGDQPRIEHYLPSLGDERLAVLAGLVRCDVRHRLRQGESVEVATYLLRFPDLGQQPVIMAELIAGEYASRGRHVPDLKADEYLERYAQYRHELCANHADLFAAPPVKSAVTGDDSESQTLATASGDESAPHLQSFQPHIPGYEVLGELGRGGMGIVFKARQQSLNRVVALKLVQGGGLEKGSNPSRFRKEAEAIARLQHPNIVQIHDIGECEGRPFLSLEFVEGGTLERQIAGQPWPAPRAAALVEELARAIHAAHLQKIVHRDLKPANILLTREGVPKITDFGLAKLMELEHGDTHTGQILGTPSYMAPEQAEGRSRNVGPAADVYALGAILFELLTGKPPFRGPNLLDTIRQVITEEPVLPKQMVAQIPGDLRIICLKCLDKTPARRFGSAAELADDLRRFLAHEPIQARRTPSWERGWRWVRRNPETTLVRGLNLLMVLFMLTAVLMSDRGAHLAWNCGILAMIGTLAFLFCLPWYGPTLALLLVAGFTVLGQFSTMLDDHLVKRLHEHTLAATAIGLIGYLGALRYGLAPRRTVLPAFTGALLGYLSMAMLMLVATAALKALASRGLLGLVLMLAARLFSTSRLALLGCISAALVATVLAGRQANRDDLLN